MYIMLECGLLLPEPRFPDSLSHVLFHPTLPYAGFLVSEDLSDEGRRDDAPTKHHVSARTS